MVFNLFTIATEQIYYKFITLRFFFILQAMCKLILLLKHLFYHTFMVISPSPIKNAFKFTLINYTYITIFCIYLIKGFDSFRKPQSIIVLLPPSLAFVVINSMIIKVGKRFHFMVKTFQKDADNKCFIFSF